MALTITFVAPDGHACDPLALQQSVEWLAKLNASTHLSPPNGVSAEKAKETVEADAEQGDEPQSGSMTTTTRRGRGGRRPGVASAEQQVTALETASQQQVEQQPATTHAIPPGMSSAPQPQTGQQPAPQPPTPIALPPGVAVQSAPAAAGPPVAPPVTAPVQAPAAAPTQAPAAAAMPQVPPAPNGADSGLSMEDIRSLWASKSKQAFKIGRADAWADGTAKPRFLTVEAMPKDIYERFAEELAAV